MSEDAAVRVRDLRKVFSVPVREGGLRATARSLLRRGTRDVAAAGGWWSAARSERPADARFRAGLTTCAILPAGLGP